MLQTVFLAVICSYFKGIVAIKNFVQHTFLLSRSAESYRTRLLHLYIHFMLIYMNKYLAKLMTSVVSLHDEKDI
jgi:hypothetical protein